MLNRRIRIVSDYDGGGNPRKLGDYSSVLLSFYGRYDFTDANAPSINPSDYSGWAAMREALEKSENLAAILPVYLYDHSGLRMSTEPFGCEWDSGQLGWICIRRDKMADFGIKRLTKAAKAKLEDALRSEIEEMDLYLTEGYYGFVAEEKVDGEWSEVDSCWGFLGRDYKTNGMADHFSHLIGEGYEIVEDN